MELILHLSPRQYNLDRNRWRLQDLPQVVPWLQGRSEAAVSRLLRRLGFGRKQAMNFIRSPDPRFRTKYQAILGAYAEALAYPERVVCLFMDEFTYYRQPGVAPAYHRRGKTQPLARQVARHNTQTRLVAVLNGLTGQVHYLQRSKIGKEELPRFYQQVRAAYPRVERLYLIQDNWPTHQLHSVMAALGELGLTPLFLPTYASWLNPIEKLWRWLKQEVLHLHRLAHDLDILRQQVLSFLDQFASPSDDLLRYVGLLSE